MKPRLSSISVGKLTAAQFLKQSKVAAGSTQFLWQKPLATANLPRATNAAERSNSYRFAIAVVAPVSQFTAHGGSVVIKEQGLLEKTISTQDIFAELRNWLRQASSSIFPGQSDPEVKALLTKLKADGLEFTCGAVGYISYDAISALEQIAGLERHPTEPEMLFVSTNALVIFDRLTETAHVLTLPSTLQSEEQSSSLHFALYDELLTLTAQSRPSTVGQAEQAEQSSDLLFCEQTTRCDFITEVEAAKEYIRAGDIFQVVLSNRYVSSIQVDPYHCFDFLLQTNPSPYHFLVHTLESSIVGASPEVMLKSRGIELRPGERTVEVSMRPVAGTYPREQGSERAEQSRGPFYNHQFGSDQGSAAKTLVADTKERAEHLMLVDHARNDIGKVSEIGSVRVDDLFSVETYSDVFHLVSEVSGRLNENSDTIDALASCFPIATLTGTPKIRAMEIVAELEDHPRGIFGGAIVSLGADGSLDSTVAIRFLRTDSNGCSIQTGAGIVIDSIAEREYEECRWKARALFRAANQTRRNISGEPG